MSETRQDAELRVLLAGGGTGGHVMPGAATAEAIGDLPRPSRVLFLTGQRHGEQRCRHALDGFEAVEVPETPWRGARAKVMFPWRASASAGAVLSVLRAFRPHVVIGLGSYNSVVPVLLGRLSGARTMLLESNAIPGGAVRLLAPVADCVVLQWEEAAGWLRARRVLTPGNPVRRSVLEGDRQEARRRLGLSPSKCTLLAMGGSQGALTLNEALYGALRLLDAAGADVQVIHLTGPDHVAAALELCGQLRMPYRPAGFTNRMAEVYAAADFVLSRAGGSSLAELTALGLPSILVPYPHAADGHQMANARVLARASAAWVIPQRDLTPELLADAVGSLAADARTRARMARCARATGRPRAAGSVAAEVARIAAASRRSPDSTGGQGTVPARFSRAA